MEGLPLKRPFLQQNNLFGQREGPPQQKAEHGAGDSGGDDPSGTLAFNCLGLYR